MALQNWEQTYPLSPGGGVYIEQESGAVRVSGWDQPSVKVRACSNTDDPIEERIAVEVRPDAFFLKVTPGDYSFLGLFHIQPPVALELMIPFGSHVAINSGSGAVEVLSTRGAARIETGSGSVAVAEVGDTRLETGSGSVAARSVQGSLDIETGSGSVDVQQVAGAVHLETGSGRVSARQVGGGLHVECGSGSLAIFDVMGGAELETGSGSVTVERVQGPFLRLDSGGGTVRMVGLDVQALEVDSSSGSMDVELIRVWPGASYDIETGSGGVTVRVPHDAGLDLNLESNSGRVIYTGLNVRVHHSEPGELEGRLNHGGATLSVEAGSGSIQIRPLEGMAAAQVPPPAPVAPAAPVAPTAPPAPVAATVDSLAQAFKADPALESSEAMRRVLNMVAEGKLSPTEAEAILRALDEEETTK